MIKELSQKTFEIDLDTIKELDSVASFTQNEDVSENEKILVNKVSNSTQKIKHKKQNSFDVTTIHQEN